MRHRPYDMGQYLEVKSRHLRSWTAPLADQQTGEQRDAALQRSVRNRCYGLAGALLSCGLSLVNCGVCLRAHGHGQGCRQPQPVFHDEPGVAQVTAKGTQEGGVRRLSVGRAASRQGDKARFGPARCFTHRAHQQRPEAATTLSAYDARQSGNCRRD